MFPDRNFHQTPPSLGPTEMLSEIPIVYRVQAPWLSVWGR